MAASTGGTGGIEVRPAPSRAARSRWEDVPSRRVTLLPPLVRADPSAVEASRFEARDTVDGVWAMPAGAVGTDAALWRGSRGRRAADVAVAVEDRSPAARLGARQVVVMSRSWTGPARVRCGGLLGAAQIGLVCRDEARARARSAGVRSSTSMARVSSSSRSPSA